MRAAKPLNCSTFYALMPSWKPLWPCTTTSLCAVGHNDRWHYFIVNINRVLLVAYINHTRGWSFERRSFGFTYALATFFFFLAPSLCRTRHFHRRLVTAIQYMRWALASFPRLLAWFLSGNWCCMLGRRTRWLQHWQSLWHLLQCKKKKKKKDTELSLQQVLAVGGLEPRLECTARVADVVPALWNWSCTSCHGRMAG